MQAADRQYEVEGKQHSHVTISHVTTCKDPISQQVHSQVPQQWLEHKFRKEVIQQWGKISVEKNRCVERQSGTLVGREGGPQISVEEN